MELLYRLFYASVAAASILYLVFKLALGYWKRRGILSEPAKTPWGNLQGVGSKKHVTDVLQILYEKYKGKSPFIGIYAWLKPMLLILDIDSINYILNKDSEYFMGRGLYSNTIDDPLSQNMLQTDGAEWQNLNIKNETLQWRRKIQKTFPALFRVQQKFDKSLQEHQNQAEFSCNITELVEGFNIDAISSLVFGLEGDSIRYKDTEFRKMCKNYMQQNNNIYKSYFSFCFPKLAQLFKYRLYSLQATKYFQKLISDKLYEREYMHSQQFCYDFIQIWCDSRKCANVQTFKKLTMSEIVAQAFNFILAGLESSTTVVACCLYELSLQPEIQANARREVRAICEKYHNKLTEEALIEMVYLKQVLNETLRKHSPYPFLLRLTTKDYELPNSIFMLKKGNNLIIPTAAIHNDASFYQYPDKFYPDHFHSSKVESRPLCAFLPFGLGQRSCTVQYFAQQQMMACLATLLNRYSFTPHQTTVIPLTYDNSLLLRKPKEDITLIVKKV